MLEGSGEGRCSSIYTQKTNVKIFISPFLGCKGSLSCIQEETKNFTSLTVPNEPIPFSESKPLLIKGRLGSYRADVESIFEEYACPNIVTRRPPFRVPLLMTARFQRTPPARLGLQDCHLRDLLLPFCHSVPCPLCLALLRFFLARD